jgi:uncharacterized protein YgiB involved in biofilm formation
MAIKHSKSVALVLLASVAVVSCAVPDEEDPGEQRLYRSKADCLAEWKEERYCERNTSAPYPGTYYYGPRFYRTGGRLVTVNGRGMVEPVAPDVPATRILGARGAPARSRSAAVVRGGFGGSALGHFGGG